MAEQPRPRRRRKPRPLVWYDTEFGPFPDCVECADRLLSPMFVEAVFSVSMEQARSDPAGLARRTIDHFHSNGHQGM